MSERDQEFRLGVVVLAAVLVTAVLVVWFGDPVAMVRSRYTVFIAIREAPGVSTNTPVRRSGIRIGQIIKVEFAEDLGLDFNGVILTAEIDRDRRIRRSDVARVGGSLLGDAVVEIIDGGAGADAQAQQAAPPADQFLQPGDTIVGVPTQDPMQALSAMGADLSVAIGSVARTADEIAVLARNINSLVGDNEEQLARIFDKTERAVENISAGASSLNEVLNDPQMRANLQRSINELPNVLSELTKAVGGIQNTLRLADQNLANLEGLTEPLGQKAGPLIDKVDRAAGQLEIVVTEFAVLARNLNSPEGTINRLLSDPQLYDQLVSTIENVNDLTYELRPILRDARVFTDKIAREPSQLGVRGALQRPSGLK